MATRVTIHRAQLERLLRSPDGPVWQHVARLARQVENRAKTTAPVDEGTYRASISHTVRLSGTRITGRIGSPLHYAWFIEVGTGIYGPRKRPIRPVSGKYLVFEPGRGMGPLPKGGKHPPKGKRGMVFAQQVKGSPPKHVLENALRETVPGPVRRLW